MAGWPRPGDPLSQGCWSVSASERTPPPSSARTPSHHLGCSMGSPAVWGRRGRASSRSTRRGAVPTRRGSAVPRILAHAGSIAGARSTSRDRRGAAVPPSASRSPDTTGPPIPDTSSVSSVGSSPVTQRRRDTSSAAFDSGAPADASRSPSARRPVPRGPRESAFHRLARHARDGSGPIVGGLRRSSSSRSNPFVAPAAPSAAAQAPTAARSEGQASASANARSPLDASRTARRGPIATWCVSGHARRSSRSPAATGSTSTRTMRGARTQALPGTSWGTLGCSPPVTTRACGPSPTDAAAVWCARSRSMATASPSLVCGHTWTSSRCRTASARHRRQVSRMACCPRSCRLM